MPAHSFYLFIYNFFKWATGNWCLIGLLGGPIPMVDWLGGILVLVWGPLNYVLGNASYPMCDVPSLNCWQLRYGSPC